MQNISLRRIKVFKLKVILLVLAQNGFHKVNLLFLTYALNSPKNVQSAIHFFQKPPKKSLNRDKLNGLVFKMLKAIRKCWSTEKI